ncbi:MAG: hypothetical protein AABW89_01860 [Nanoarchaeota archaeon]
MTTELSEIFLLNFINSIIEIKAQSIPKETNDSLIQISVRAKNEEFPKRQAQMFTNPPIKIIQKRPLIRNPLKIIETVRGPPSRISSTEKLNNVLRDPYVTEIEFSGVDTPITVRKSGISQKTQIKLSVEEAYDLIAEFSQKTKIPAIDGKIKAALDNLTISANLSTPSFIIQKRRN